MTQSRYYSSTAVKTTLSLSIDAAATQIQVASDSGFPTQFPFTLILEKDTANEEIVTATALVGANYTVTRGVDGTSAKSHAIGATVEHGVAALDFTESRQHEGASVDVHGIGATNSVVGTGTNQTLTNKTLTSPSVASPTVTGVVSGSATYNNIVVASPTINSGTLGTNLAAGLYRITNLGDPTSAQDAVTRTWAETAMSSQLANAQTASANAATASANALASQTAAANSATNAATASANAATASANAATASANAATSATNAQTASANAAASQTAAATSATNAATASANAATASANAAASETAAAASAASAATSFDNFDDRYLGQKATDPTLDNDGNALITGALYFNTSSNAMKVYTGSTWNVVAPDTSQLITKDIVTTKGDLIVATANASPTRLGVGLDLYVLTASSTAPAGVAWQNAAALAAPVTNRNLIYNGAMQVAQRGTSTTGITGIGYFTADRYVQSTGAMGTWTQTVENDAPTGSGFRRSWKTLCTTAASTPAADGFLIFRQTLEGQDLQRIRKGTSSAQQLTLSFWVKANVTGTYIAELLDADNNRQVGAQYTISASGTWEKKTITFPADTTGAFDNDNAGSLQVNLFLGAGTDRTSGTLNTTWASTTNANRAVGQTNLAAATNNFWQITGVQLEVGDTATEFEFKSYGQELAECQRYFYMHANGTGKPICMGAMFDATSVYGVIQFPVTMRATGVGVYSTGTNYYSFLRNGGSDEFNGFLDRNGSTTGITIYANANISGTAGHAGWLETANAAASVAFSAEL